MVADPPGSSQYRSIGNGHHPERHLAFPASTDRCGSWPVFKRMREGGNAIRRSAMALNLTQKQEVVAELAEVAGSAHSLVAARSEERRVGKECGDTVGFRWAPDH